VDAAIEAGLGWCRAHQQADGHWVGRLESNACMEAEWVLALHVLGLPLRPRLARALLEQQRPDGSWEVFRDAPAGDINATVESYAALRALGQPPDAPELARARRWILERGGFGEVRVFTRYWLALIGAWPWERTPNLPPEIALWPSRLGFGIYDFASWARATLMPLAVLSAIRPVVPLPGDDRLDELFPEGRAHLAAPRPASRWSWEAVFSGLDRGLHGAQARGWVPLRGWAIEQVLAWIVRHQDADGVWGGIQPPWIYSLLALYAAGYPLEHPVLARGLAALEDPRWRMEAGAATRVAASVSPVWDTLLTMLAVEDAGAVEALEAPFARALDWILHRQSRRRGDWSVRDPHLEPGGWAFEYENVHYPDIDDTAAALIVLGRLRGHPRFGGPRLEAALDRGAAWVLGLQSRNGGWAAFDRDNDRALLTKIPFCDFGEVLDPPSADVTGHVLEALAGLGHTRGSPAVARALRFLEREQEPEGSWFGRWGVNHIYGTGAVLPALEALGVDMRSRSVQRAADWLVGHQNPDGGWGESCVSYMDPGARGRGPSTPSQTAWALLGLCAAARPEDARARRQGVAWLLEHQSEGTWPEELYTGTGFPGYGGGRRVRLEDPGRRGQIAQGVELSRAFMIRYDMYRHYFPLMALGRLRRRGLLGDG
jgi:squalene-hopene/tetraprenyl-beta-curcumene cyclase